MSFVSFEYGKVNVISGSDACAIGAKLCRPKVIPMYPITPQTVVAERLAEFVHNDELKAEMILVESEHSAASALMSAQATGVRTFTSTSSQGLALMHEILFIISGLRLPCVMGVANRALSAPINIWCDEQDSISSRDSGWIQLFCESAQEILDTTIMAYRIAETVQLPVMVCFDGFILSHTYEPVNIPTQKQVDDFVPEYKPEFKLDIEKPITVGCVAGPDSYMEFRKQQYDAMLDSLKVIKEVSSEFKKEFKRNYGNGLIETYKINDAKYALVALGSVCTTARQAIDELRKEGKKVGLIKVKSLRPFPEQELNKLFSKIKYAAVLDRNISPGQSGALYSELKSALFNNTKTKISNFIAGLGGRDIKVDDIKSFFKNVKSNTVNWVNCQ